MRTVRTMLRVSLTLLRVAAGVTVSSARAVTRCLLWLVAPRVCLVGSLLRRR
jgi:hypothetical protein